MIALDIEARQEKEPDAAIPLNRQRLHLVLEPHEDPLAKMIDAAHAIERDVELEHTLQRPGTFRVARVGRDLTAALGGERRARQILSAGRYFAQHFSFQDGFRL